MNAGELSTRITIQKPVKTTDAAGQVIATWDEHGKFWAKVVTGAAGEALQDGKQISEDVRWLIELRYSTQTAAIAADWRLLIGQQVLSIQSAVNHNNENKRMQLTALERKQ